MKPVFPCIGLLLVWLLSMPEGVFAYNSDSLVADLQLGIETYRSGDYPQAYEIMSFAEGEVDLLDLEDSLYGRFYIEAGLVAYLSGNFAESGSYYQLAWDRIGGLKGGLAKERVDCLYRMGILEREMGDLHLGLDHLEGAYDLTVLHDLKLDGGKCRNALGNLYNRMGQYEEALAAFQEAKTILGSVYGDDHPIVSAIIESMGTSYLGLDSLAAALAVGEEVLAIRLKKMGASHPNVAIAYNHLGEVHLALEQPELARAYFQKAKTIWSRELGPAHINMAIVNYNLGDAALLEKAYPLVFSAYAEAERILFGRSGIQASNGDFSNGEPISWLQYLEVLKRKARATVSLAEANPDLAKDAMPIYRELHTVICQLRMGFKREASRQELVALSWESYEAAIDLAVRLSGYGDKERWSKEALGFAEAAHGVLLEAALSGSQAMKFAGVPAELVARERGLRTEVVNWTQQLDAARQEGGLPSVISNLMKERLASNQALNALVDTFSHQYPQYYQFKYASSQIDAPWDEVDLDLGTVVLKYFVGEENVYGFVKTREGVSAMKLGSRFDLDKGTKSLRNALQNRRSYQTQALALAQQFVHPLLEAKGEGMDLWLVILRDGSLENIPFDVLPLPDESGGMMVERYPISYGYSLGSYFRSKGDVAELGTGSYTGLARSFEGDPASELGLLPNAIPEVEMVQDLLGGDVFLNEEATEARFRSMSQRKGILHFATHAILDNGNPLYSRLALTSGAVGESEDDGWVHTYELFAMEMEADLAILNACHTGGGQLQKGEGLLGLSTGFAFAGVPSIYMNHWESDDREGVSIMEEFIKGLQAGLRKNVALQQAKKYYLAQADEIRSHPYFWANPGLIGDYTPMKFEEKRGWGWILWVGGGIALLLVGVWLFRSRKK